MNNEYKLKLENGKLYYWNGVLMGDVEQDVDGYYKFWPVLRGGYWEETTLRMVADVLQSLNKTWDTEVQRSLG